MCWTLKWRLGPELNRRTGICSPLHHHSATEPVVLQSSGLHRLKEPSSPLMGVPGPWTQPLNEKTPLLERGSNAESKTGAGNEVRTRDLNLGKVALYQLSYSRVVGALLSLRRGALSTFFLRSRRISLLSGRNAPARTTGARRPSYRPPSTRVSARWPPPAARNRSYRWEEARASSSTAAG